MPKHALDFSLGGLDEIAPIVTANMVLFETKLPASKTAGVEAIRLARVNDDIKVEELNAQRERIIGFVMHPLLERGKKVTAVAITPMGSSGTPSPLTPAQRAALALITNELTQFKASWADGPVARDSNSDGRQALEAISVGIECGVAAVEGGVNPIEDVLCVIAFGELLGGDSGEGHGDPGAPVIDVPPDEEPDVEGSNTSHDDSGGGDSGDGSQSGDDSGEVHAGGGGGTGSDDEESDQIHHQQE
jgi:hypothetical protein